MHGNKNLKTVRGKLLVFSLAAVATFAACADTHNVASGAQQRMQKKCIFASFFYVHIYIFAYEKRKGVTP